MKNMKKTTYIWAITLVITGLVTTSAVSIYPECSEETTLVREIDLTVSYLIVEATKITMTEKFDNTAPINDGSNIICDTEYDDYHPTVAGDLSGRFFAGFELTMDDVDYYPDFWYSIDGGTTWEEAGYFSESLGSEYPDADSNDHGFYATFGASITNPGGLWLIDASDPSNIGGYLWPFGNSNINDFRHPGISCFTHPNDAWNWGGQGLIGYNGYEGNNVDGCAFVFYQTDGQGYATIEWMSDGSEAFGNCVHADFAIDEVTRKSYAVYDQEVDSNIVVRKDNFMTHDFISAYDVGDGETNIMNPSIEANDDIIIVVADSNNGVVCFYSSNGFTSVQQSTVEDGASFPEVMLSPDGTFVCSYIKDGVLYTETSADGAVWADSETVADNDVNDRFGSHDLAKGVTGVFGVWEDTRNADLDIYFSNVTTVEVPILEITSIVGGLGATATVKNTGNGPATDVELSITVTGGILGLINKNASDTVVSLAVDEEATISSGIIFGLGAVEIVAIVTCAEGSSDEETAEGKQILIFTMIS